MTASRPSGLIRGSGRRGAGRPLPQPVSVRFTARLLETIRAAAAAEGSTVSDWVRGAVTTAIAAGNGPPPAGCAHTWDDEGACAACGKDMFAITFIGMRCRACGTPFAWSGTAADDDGAALDAAGSWARRHLCEEGKPA